MVVEERVNVCPPLEADEDGRIVMGVEERVNVCPPLKADDDDRTVMAVEERVDNLCSVPRFKDIWRSYAYRL
jgi:hypothetical protein